MNTKYVSMQIAIIVLSGFVFFGSCSEKDEADDGNGACVPLGHYPDSSKWPYFSQCTEKSASMEKSSDGTLADCSGESVLLSWDGNILLVWHDCIPGQCGWKFEYEYVFEENVITLIERDTATELTGCSCQFRGAFKENVAPGNYEYRIVKDASAAGNGVETRLSEPIELSASEPTEYCFHIAH